MDGMSAFEPINFIRVFINAHVIASDANAEMVS